MRRLLCLTVLTLCSIFSAAHADEAKPDDRVAFTLTAEDWVTTKTARVVARVDSAVAATATGSARAEMVKAVNNLAPAEWRLTEFNRMMDQTGLERWSAHFEARLPESDLGSLADTAKKLSKAGMQITINTVDFSPTLDEVEATRAALRVQLYKKVQDQLAALNSAIPGRNYRIADVELGNNENPGIPQPYMAKAMLADAAAA
ncbi:MAG: hypothetical protein JO253_01540, partial [Alphaproteobacteria bacterium]|nr:hypothetical protein [Alphaproteobacteria bacterium]